MKGFLQKNKNKEGNNKSLYRKILFHTTFFSAYLLSVYIDLHTVGILWYRIVLVIPCILHVLYIIYNLYNKGYIEVGYIALMGIGINMIGIIIYSVIWIFCLIYIQ